MIYLFKEIILKNKMEDYRVEFSIAGKMFGLTVKASNEVDALDQARKNITFKTVKKIKQ